jgi:hypothetical protein
MSSYLFRSFPEMRWTKIDQTWRSNVSLLTIKSVKIIVKFCDKVQSYLRIFARIPEGFCDKSP